MTITNINIVSQIENMMGDLSPANLVNSGYIRLSASDVSLDIRAGTVYLDLSSEAIIVLGDTRNIEYYGGFEYIEEDCVMKVQMGNVKVTAYLNECDRVQECFDHYYNEYLPDLEAEEQRAKNEGL